ncbi:MAG: GNAT family N-acetyltransferase [Microcoleaceae cyanobacterium]
MKIYQFEKPQLFYNQAKQYLFTNAAKHHLLLRIIHTLIDHPERYPIQPYLLIVKSQNSVIAVAIQTPPYGLVLSQIQDLQAIKLIIENLSQNQIKLPTVSGLPTETKAFVEKWSKLTQKSYYLENKLKIHCLTQVNPINQSNGELRLATLQDRELLLEWCQAFITEAIPNPENVEHLVDSHLNQKSLYIWQDLTPVSIVAGSGNITVGGNISLVYTPPQYRQKGYASSSVAAVTQHLLNRGYPNCYLFTDLANPTANHIYHQIGYQPICDWHHYQFQNY